MKLKKFLVGMTALALLATPVSAQTLRYATIGEPPSLDLQMGTATLASTISQNMFETLYAFDETNAPQPYLVTGEQISEDGKTIVLTLRDGVLFHDGDTLTAEDVAASLNRWAEHGARGKILGLDNAAVTGDLEVTLHLKEVNGAWKSILAYINGGPVIYPADIVTAAAGEPIAAENYVGTGPYRFGELRPNRYVELIRFDDYTPNPGESNGAAGTRVANFEKLHFIPVPDVGTRLSGVQAGDYDYAEYISGDLFGLVKDDPAVQVKISAAPIFGLMFMNSENGPLADNTKLRQAIVAALNMEQALQVSVGEQELYDASGVFFAEGNIWHTTAGSEAYSEGNPEKAKALAADAGYDGTPIKLLVSTNYKAHFDNASVFTRQLADAGINVQMVVVDWATLLKLRGQPEQWDMFMTHHGDVPDPVLLTVMNESYPGWWQTEEKRALMAQLTGTSVLEERQAAWEKMQALIWEQLPTVRVGSQFSYDIASPDLKTPWEKAPVFPYFWGASK
ncbi:MAG: ABC transporter substrate-binding protein [Rhodobacteraceae bacterium]|nr:ABC transporter substrate-binding protein [Paracoccaceae bacterium]